ncbi:Gfo/Idh/MocA family protein [Levilactobacillus bambusae]|uniref:Oxidoreductase n=1 Tax=Levilactobacillus bambusae TaxID=2024736 RepID=A0A2V1MY15_9LACO|nr:Gfo/Idh/MocA family oxidoreductase [Levilactobacillus bambusae]PWF99930.1 oxidoreductase [Levilactobacillus bambusae]
MLKLGTIGTNWITQQFVEAATESGEYTLTSVYSRTKGHADEFAQKNGADQTYTDLQDMLESGNVDVVYVASPNSLHFSQAKQVIVHDLNVIVEKPAFVNPAEMKEFQLLLKEHPKALYFEAARNIHTPNFQAIASQVDKMSTIQGATFTYMKYSSRYDKVLAGETPNIFTAEFAGGALQDLGVYTAYDAVTLFGMPKKATYFPDMISTGVDGKGIAILQYPKFTVSLNFGKTSTSYQTSEIYGLKDTLIIDNAGELDQVDYLAEDGTLSSLGTKLAGNSMIPEATDFAAVMVNPTNERQQERYTKWFKLSVEVNQLLFDLRQSAGIVFPSDETDFE